MNIRSSMKSSLVNTHTVDLYRYLVVFLILCCARQSWTGVVPSSNSVSLYNANDKIAILTGHNFSSTVYQSKTAWLIEFYASWCGHCQAYANTYREVAIDTWGWKTVVRIGAINCYAEENNAVCDQHHIGGYPTLRIIAPETMLNTSKEIKIVATDAKGVERELIKELDALHRTSKDWPNFMPMNRATFDDLYGRVPSSVRLVLVIVEKRDDFTGRQVMLDFSKYYEQLVIFRATTDGRLWRKFQINMTDVPALFVILPNRTAERISTEQYTNTSENIGSRNLFNYAIRTYIHQRKCIDNFDDRDLEEIIHSKNALKNAESIKNSDKSIKEARHLEEKETVPKKIAMVDLETALSYMLRREIPRAKEIQGESYDALIHWLNALIKYFPGREPVISYLRTLLDNVNQQPENLTGTKFRELADINTPTRYLPNNQNQYQYCTGSSPQYRGYPCGLWLLFHTLTVSQVHSESEGIQVIELPSAIKNFIKYFFSCRHCSDNFMTETSDIHQIDSKNKHAAVLYLWKIHNLVNQRLRGDETEDPKYPKIQFPSAQLCSNCRSQTDDFDIPKTLDFLLKFYSEENIDISSVGNSTSSSDAKKEVEPDSERKASLDQYSMMEIDGMSTHKSRFFRSIPSILHSFSFYFLIVLLIGLVFARRRYCKAKRKRYTL